VTAVSADQQAWHDFMEQPVGYIHPERLAKCFHGHVSAELCGKLTASGRLRRRLGEMIRLYYLLPPADAAHESGDERDLIIAMAPPEALAAIVPRAGAIYWSGAIAGTVRAADVAALQTQIGEELCNFAVQNRDLSAGGSSLPSTETIGDRVTASGWLCMAAWCDALHPAIAARVRLKMPPNTLFDTPLHDGYAERAPDIVRRAAMG
jgi:YOP proteins translocation protein K (YscK)